MSSTEAQKRAYRNYYNRNKSKENARTVKYIAEHRDAINARRRRKYKEDFEHSEMIRALARKKYKEEKELLNEKSKIINTDTSV